MHILSDDYLRLGVVSNERELSAGHLYSFSVVRFRRVYLVIQSLYFVLNRRVLRVA